MLGEGSPMPKFGPKFLHKKRKQITQTFPEVELSFPYNPRLYFLNIKVLLNQLRKLQSEMLALTQERSDPWV